MKALAGDNDPADLLKMDAALSALGIAISENDSTDPQIMVQVLNDLKIHFDHAPQTTDELCLLQRLTKEPIPLAPLKEMIMRGIQQNPPLYHTLLEISALYEGDSPVLSAKPLQQLKYGIYLIVILETLTYLIVNNISTEQSIIPQLFNNRHSVNYGSSFWNFLNKYRESKSIFLALKTISVDPFMFEDLCFREYSPCPNSKELANFYKKYRLKGLNHRILKQSVLHYESGQRNYGWLYGNILEAVTKEAMVAKKQLTPLDNIKTGLAMLYRLDHSEEASAFQYQKAVFDFDPLCKASLGQSSFWQDLYARKDANNHIKSSTLCTKPFINTYEAWNLAFMVRAFPERSYLYIPKLVIPSTLSCMPEYYFGSRMVSLWLTINFLSSLRKKSPNSLINYRIADMDKILAILGRHNLQYAKETMLNNGVDLDKLYEEMVQNRHWVSNYLQSVHAILS